MWAEARKLTGSMGGRIDVTWAVALSWPGARDGADVPVLSPLERRVLRAMRDGAELGEYPTAVELARSAGLTLRELETVCDRLLELGFIGPRAARSGS